MDEFDDCANRAWNDILNKIKSMDAAGVKRAEISRLLGHKGRSAVTNWLNGETSSRSATFSDMLRYLSVLGLDLSDYVPLARPVDECPEIRRQLAVARETIRRLQEELAEARGQLAGMQKAFEIALEKRSADGEKKSQTSNASDDGNQAAG